MMARLTRRRATASTAARKRRRTVWAREDHSALALPAAGVAQNLLEDYTVRRGLTQGANPAPGMTVGGIRLSLGVAKVAGVTENRLWVGVVVTNEVDPAQVLRPQTDIHADWLWRSVLHFPSTAAFQRYDGVDELIIRSKRRMDEIDMQLWIVFDPDEAAIFDVTMASSTLCILP